MRSTSRAEARGPRRGRQALLLGILLGLLLPAAASVRFAPGLVPGRYFDPATSGWGQRLISLYRDDRGQVTVRGGNGRGRVEAVLSRDEADRLLKALEDGLARMQARHSRPSSDIVELLRIVHGEGVDVHGLAVTYLGDGPEGGGPVLQLFLQDRRRPIAHKALYLGPRETERLVGMLSDLLASPPAAGG